MYCTACGEIQSDLAHFCPSCGNKLSVSGRATTPQHRKQGRDIDTKQQKSGSDGLAFFIISILCIAAIFLPLGSFGESFFNRATADCTPSPVIQNDGSISDWDDPDCELKNGGIIAILFLGLIGLICLLLSRKRTHGYEGHKSELDRYLVIQCDRCGINCTAQSWFVQETGEDFCDVCFKNEKDHARGTRLVEGVEISTTE